MKSRINVLSSIMSEAQFIDALSVKLLAPALRNGISAVLRVRVNAHMATISRVGEHDAEIELVEPAGRRLRQCVRSSDLVAFSKPGIFLMLLKDLNSENDLATICERIIRSGKRQFQVAAKQVYSSFNVGAAIISDEDTDAISLVSRATATMYQRNRYGDGGFELFPDEIAVDYSDPLAIESYISNALQKDLFELDYQPQYRSDGGLIGAGAKIRMYTPGGQRLSGEAFLPGVEERRLVVQVSERALGQLCFQTGDWLRRGIPIPSLSLAVADPHFLQADFPRMVSVLLHNAGIPGTLLELELTEATIMADFETARRTLNELATLGVRLALRGVNMGPFLASYVPRLPIATLQLSCSPNALPSVDSLPLLRAVISQGHRLGLRVTSKDIQTVEQMTALRVAGCDGFQGPLLSEPLRKDKMEKMLLAWNSPLKESV
jgi:EAL domain-containing protein (putative c-di-GMP-specific phosphodiesterase class I)/GGDEF domain-containing protein